MIFYNRARVEMRVVRTEDNQMKGYLNLCAMESNQLSDPSYLHPETRVARQAMAVGLLIRQLRWGWFHVNEGNILDAAKRAAKYSVPRFHYDSVLRWYRDYRSNSCEGFTASIRGMAAKFCIVNDAHEDLIVDIKAYLEGFSFSPISPLLCHKVAFMINNLGQMLKRKGQLTTAKFCHHLNNVILPRHKELPSALVHPATNEMPYISHTTAYNLMQHLGLKYGSLKKGFIQDHERKDVVEARHIFIATFLHLKRRMHLYRQKRSRNGRYYYNSRLEVAEGECSELQECIEQQKILLLEEKEAKLQQKKRKVKDLSDDLRKYKSRVLKLEADKYFLAAENHKISVREKTLLEKLDMLQQEESDRAKKVRDQKRKAEYRMKHQLLKAFE